MSEQLRFLEHLVTDFISCFLQLLFLKQGLRDLRVKRALLSVSSETLSHTTRLITSVQIYLLDMGAESDACLGETALQASFLIKYSPELFFPRGIISS